jgi:hypothetical protein
VPEGRKTKEGEVYCKGRFFTMTGGHMADLSALAPRVARRGRSR